MFDIREFDNELNNINDPEEQRRYLERVVEQKKPCGSFLDDTFVREYYKILKPVIESYKLLSLYCFRKHPTSLDGKRKILWKLYQHASAEELNTLVLQQEG